MNFDFKIEGLDEVIKKMKVIKGEMVSADINIAVAAGAKVIQEKAIENAKQIDDPLTPEKIHENITFRVRKPRGKGDVIVGKVGIKGGSKSGKKQKNSDNPGGDTRHWRHIEFGTANKAARPFMRRALSENTAKATDAIVKSLSDTVDRLSK
jgi:HK97 gp10 family phage protein